MEAGADPAKRERFLYEEQQHILRLTIRILGRQVTMSDDEWSIALMATSESLDRYALDKGSFWNFAAVVIKSRLLDYYRSNSRGGEEILVRPESFSGDFDEDGDIGLEQEIKEKTAVSTDRTLRDEIEALSQELAALHIDFFELAEVSPKSDKTRKGCAAVLKAFFRPPPLLEEMKNSGTFPVKQLLSRMWTSRKMIERHRKYLMAAALIMGGDYPGLKEYLPKT